MVFFWKIPVFFRTIPGTQTVFPRFPENIRFTFGENFAIIEKIPVQELAVLNGEMKEVVEPGTFELRIGSASDDIRMKKLITVERDKEIIIPTLADRGKGKDKKAAFVASTPITVKGVVRDVQSNPLPDVTIRVGSKQTVTDIHGEYRIRALSTDSLIVSGEALEEQRIPVEGRQLINIQMLNK